MKQQGFTLIEVLVAMFILAIGILGAGAMQMVGFQSHQDAYYRTQAMYLAGNIVDRMRANVSGVDDSTVFDDINTAEANSIPDDPGCRDSVGGCTAVQIAQADIADWAQDFNAASPVLPASSGSIQREAGTNNFTIVINWQERQWSGGRRDWAAQSYSLTVTL